MKPALYNNVMLKPDVWTRIFAKQTIDDLPKVYKFMRRRCTTWNDCLHLAREKFEKYFVNKVKTFEKKM